MKIFLNHCQNYPHFTAKKMQTRKADDIQRKSKLAFPMISATYAKKYYGVVDSKDIVKKYRAEDILDKVTSKIVYNRRDCNDECLGLYFKPEKTTKVWLDKIKSEKIGNCFESSIVTFAALIANGYYNSDMAKVNIDVQFVDNDSGKVIYSDMLPLDHSIVVSDMKKGYSPKSEKKFILDSWNNFTGEISEANGLYRATADESKIKFAIDVVRNNMESAYSGLKTVNLDNCHPRVGFYITEDGMNFDPEALIEASKYLQEKYPELRLKND